MTGRASDRWLFWLCVALSLALHAGLAAYLFWSELGKFGAVEQPTAAISVNLVSSDILDAAEQGPATEAASNPATPAAAVPPPERDPPKPEAEPELAAEDKPAEAEPQLAAEDTRAETEPKFAAQETPPAAVGGAAEADRQRIAEAASQRANDEELERQKAEQRARGEGIQQADDQARLEREDAGEAERRQRAQQRDKAQKRPARPRNHAPASAGASGSGGAQASKGRISASQGSLRNYRGSLNARIARNKPSHSGVTGTVVVQLAISLGGNLISARVVSSSGNAMLDRSALEAVRRSSPFPTPPRGAKAGDLVFTFPCYFR